MQEAAGPAVPELSFPTEWTPEQVSEFREAFDAVMAANRDRPAVQFPGPRRQVVVLEIQWDEDGKTRREMYGPWAASGDADDVSHAERAHAFLCDWQRVTGCRSDVATLTLVMDPAAWIQERAAREPSGT